MTAVLFPLRQEMVVMTRRTTHIIRRQTNRHDQKNPAHIKQAELFKVDPGNVLIYSQADPDDTRCEPLSPEYPVLGCGESDPSYRESVSSLRNNHHHAEGLTQRGRGSKN